MAERRPPTSEPFLTAKETIRQPAFMTAREVAAQLGLHPKTVLNLILRGRLPAVKLGEGKSVWRVARKDLEAFLREREAKIRKELVAAVYLSRAREEFFGGAEKRARQAGQEFLQSIKRGRR